MNPQGPGESWACLPTTPYIRSHSLVGPLSYAPVVRPGVGACERSDVNGGCLCGNIRFSATGDPDFPHLCSCEHCQRLSGAPVMSWVSFPEEGFAWTGPGGEPTWFETFPQIGRGFCPKCGSSIASKGDELGWVGVTITALDDHSGLVPVKQSFAHNAVPWMGPLS
ncbi:GFA family protein [Nocardia nova]|uniref:GFA family protein n=1 Tax=Nocardia nova TaxID=37330 RepID=UPI00280A6E91|nr:GFA family protein [Nocardia nova]